VRITESFLYRDVITGADADIDAIVALEQESFTNPWSRETLVWELANSDVTRVYLLRDEAHRAIAFCIAWVIFDELHINTLAVSAAERRKAEQLALRAEAVLGDVPSLRFIGRIGFPKAKLESRSLRRPLAQLVRD